MEGTRVLRGTTSLELLDQSLLDLSVNPRTTDLPILVAIDTENSRGKLCEVGISTFDPCCLSSAKHNDPEFLDGQIVTYCYAKGGSKDRDRYKPYRLGEPQPLRNTDLPRILRTHLVQGDKGAEPRKVILVGHSVAGDLRLLRESSGIDLAQLPNVEAIVDVRNVALPVLLTTRPPSLKKILEDLELDFIGLHNAAHDSRYTLRALLMLYAKFKWQSSTEDESEEVDDMVSLMEDIARSHKPKRRTWTVSTKVKKLRITSDIFEQTCSDGEDVLGMLALLA